MNHSLQLKTDPLRLFSGKLSEQSFSATPASISFPKVYFQTNIQMTAQEIATIKILGTIKLAVRYVIKKGNYRIKLFCIYFDYIASEFIYFLYGRLILVIGNPL